MSSLTYFSHFIVTKAFMLALILKEEMVWTEASQEPLFCASRILFEVIKMATVDTSTLPSWQEWSGTTALHVSEDQLTTMLQYVFPNISGLLCSWSLYLKEKFNRDPTSEYTIIDTGHVLSDMQMVTPHTRCLAESRASLYIS